jgi:hypothetical protein
MKTKSKQSKELNLFKSKNTQSVFKPYQGVSLKLYSYQKSNG